MPGRSLAADADEVADHGAAAIRARALCRSYGSHPAVIDLDLAVRRGEIFGFLGPNGAGKSTTIRMVVDLLRPSSGDIAVLGEDPRRGGPRLRRRIGYLPGDFTIYDRQSVADALTGLGKLRGGVHLHDIRHIAERLELDLRATVRELSKGNRQKVGLVQAFMHLPELLVLDEPTSGLDPVLRQEFIAMIEEVRADGRTVFLSSHILSEVQVTADRVGVIRAGRLVTVDAVDALRERAVRRVEIHFSDAVSAAEFGQLAGVEAVTVQANGQDFVLRCQLTGSADPLIKTAAQHTVRTLLVEEPDLEEVFLSLYRGGNHVPA